MNRTDKKKEKGRGRPAYLVLLEACVSCVPLRRPASLCVSLRRPAFLRTCVPCVACLYLVVCTASPPAPPLLPSHLHVLLLLLVSSSHSSLRRMQFNFYTLGTAFHSLPLSSPPLSSAEYNGHTATLIPSSHNILIYYSNKTRIFRTMIRR